MHVEKQFAATVFGDDGARARSRRRERVHQVPVPMVQVDANVFTEVS